MSNKVELEPFVEEPLAGEALGHIAVGDITVVIDAGEPDSQETLKRQQQEMLRGHYRLTRDLSSPRVTASRINPEQETGSGASSLPAEREQCDVTDLMREGTQLLKLANAGIEIYLLLSEPYVRENDLKAYVYVKKLAGASRRESIALSRFGHRDDDGTAWLLPAPD